MHAIGVKSSHLFLLSKREYIRMDSLYVGRKKEHQSGAWACSMSELLQPCNNVLLTAMCSCYTMLCKVLNIQAMLCTI